MKNHNISHVDIVRTAQPGAADLPEMIRAAGNPANLRQIDHLLATRLVAPRSPRAPKPRQVTSAETEWGERRLFAIDGQEQEYQRVFHEPPDTHQNN